LVESQTGSGINYDGFVADDMNKVVTELAQRMPKFCGEIRDADGRLATLFVRDWR